MIKIIHYEKITKKYPLTKKFKVIQNSLFFPPISSHQSVKNENIHK
jgi:hypothetical protein